MQRGEGMDIGRRNALLEKLKVQSIPVGQHSGPTVSIGDFFEGNDDAGSIGCNLMLHPGVNKFYKLFADIRSRRDVQDVRVEIKDLVDEHSWPFADTVFVLTSMTQGNLRDLVVALEPDEVGPFPSDSIPRDLPPLKEGMKVMGGW
jgi:hypothetical protein